MMFAELPLSISILFTGARATSRSVNYPINGFSGATIFLKGSMPPSVKIGEGEKARDFMVDFLVIQVSAAYNIIIGRPIIHDAQVVISTYII